MGRKIFNAVNVLILALLALSCLFPFINVLAVSLSSSAAVSTGKVFLIPVDFTLESYKFVIEKPEFFRAFTVSVLKVLIGVPVNMILTIMLAYPLSKTKNEFKSRNLYMWFFVVTMVFSGGLVPWYMIINATGLINSFWALIIPSAVQVFNLVILTNFFQALPKGIEEAAYIDGASHWKILWKVFVPLSLPAMATLILFCVVTHWNSWFEGLILMNTPNKYPLQSYLQTVIVNRDVKLMTMQDVRLLSMVSERTSRAAQVFVATLPVLCVYPFLQKYFTSGIVLGGVKE
ncbi:carbohydrate ABC transporter permease [Paenibacillus sp. FSL R7-0216]|uniref:carbohydrate ABC transporter permease n=1 Tax=Paenibacillus sp. FSL R7-0216 TaxID=2921677 RepID=UPI0030DB6BCE